jgi:predicted lipid carrier protein YhbT
VIPALIPLPLPPKLLAALEPLRGKVVRLELAELGLGVQLTVQGWGWRPAFGAADVTVRARLGDYAALALGREDPDSLFFSRRLSIEGDTELGLVLKNALEAAGFPFPLRCGR